MTEAADLMHVAYGIVSQRLAENLGKARAGKGKNREKEELTPHSGMRVVSGQSWAMTTALKRVRAMVVNFIMKVVWGWLVGWLVCWLVGLVGWS